ncbi:MAG: hypothetical protein K2W82_10935 [Candidatus Obscuribacterales bacterium]|nr:hypothetical protein [Candidatus Obscuribacterales bacterium]
MSTSKKILVVVSLLLIAASFVGWKLTSREPIVKPVSLDKLMVPSLELPQGIAVGVELRNESSDERWRNVKKSADGKVESAEIGYQDNRRGVYTFDENGEIKSYMAYAADDNKRLIYEASFDPSTGLVDHSRTLRTDGTAESEFHRSPDGVEQTYFYNKNGVNVRTVTLQPDGSQKIATLEDGRTVVDEVEPEVKEVNLGERKLPDGTTVPVYTVKAKGSRILSWDFRDVGGSVRHQGEFLPNGDVQLTVVVSAEELKKQDQMLKMQAEAARNGGKMPQHPTEVDPDDEDAEPPAGVVYHPYVRQVWTPYGEDWSRRFYRLKRIEIYSREGKLSQVCIFHADGITPQEVQTWVYQEYYGKHFKQQAQFFDSTGKLVTVQQFDHTSGDKPRWETDVSAQNQRGRLPAVILQELAVGSRSRVYRLTGTPFGEAVPAEGYKLPALFCDP